jgi:ubiquinone/menaquinone biosynthesis C-methylase UbiE
MPNATREKWDRGSLTYDFLTRGQDRRHGPAKQRLFAKIQGRTLLVAVGTGNDMKLLLPGSEVVAIDISSRMITKARAKASSHAGTIRLLLMDTERLAFAEKTFDTVLTVCTFCSVPNPVQGLKEIYRILKPGGQLLMFEHVRSKIGPFAFLLDLMTGLTRKIGPDLNRDTVGNVRLAGFQVRREENVYLDIVKIIEAVKKPGYSPAPP